MIRLVRADADLLDAAIAGDHALAKALGHDAIPGWATFTEALRSTRAALAEGARDPRWGTRLFVAGRAARAGRLRWARVRSAPARPSLTSIVFICTNGRWW